MTTKTENKLTKEEILKLFTRGYKKNSDFKVGMEYERLPIETDTMKAADYSIVREFLREFASNENWDYILDNFNIIGLKQNHDTITLEPGSQVELSLEPKKTIAELEEKVVSFNKAFKPILEEYGIKLLDYGVSPVSTYKNIKILPKRRYGIMAKYLWGILSDVMMRETAGIQCCFDFSSEEDAMRKFKVANKLSPFTTAMFANSPIRGGVETGYKTFRALSWLNTDVERCGFVGHFEDNFGFEDYIDNVLDTPMIFISRNEIPINLNGAITFRQFMEKGYDGYEANIEDFKLHANLYFPEVRLRKFIEIRNHDCVNHKMQYSIPALYKGILYNNGAMDEVEELLRELSYNDFSELRYGVPKSALTTPVGKNRALDYAREIFKISEKYLVKEGKDEEKYLEPLKKYLKKGISPADEILEKWNSTWDKDVLKLVASCS